MKIFTEKQVGISAFLAGPIPPGYLIYKNYKALGKDHLAYRSLALTLIFTVAFFYAIMQAPSEVLDKIPNSLFTAFYGIIVFAFFRLFMANDVDKALEEGATKGSNWTVASTTITGLILNLALIFGLAITQPYYEGEVIAIDGNELYYDLETVPLADANKLVSQFKSMDFFGPNYGNIARLELKEGRYIITMLVDESVWSDSEIMSSLGNMKWLMKVEFGRDTDLKLESVSLSGVTKYKAIE